MPAWIDRVQSAQYPRSGVSNPHACSLALPTHHLPPLSFYRYNTFEACICLTADVYVATEVTPAGMEHRDLSRAGHSLLRLLSLLPLLSL